jgi:hypothetical protein
MRKYGIGMVVSPVLSIIKRRNAPTRKTMIAKTVSAIIIAPSPNLDIDRSRLIHLPVH